MARDGRVMTAHDALSAVLSASALLAADQLDMRNAVDVLSLVVEMQSEISSDVEINHPQLAQKPEFANFRKNTEILKGLLSERRATADAIQNLAAYGQKSADIVASVFAGGPPVAFDDEASKPQKSAAAAPSPEKKAGMDWDTVKGISSLDLPPTITVDGREWTLVDKIDVMDKDSEESHNLAINDAKDSYRSRQKLKYPDGTTLEDVGRAHVGGYCQYTVKGLTPGKDLAIIRRMDYVYGDYELEFSIDGKNAGTCSCAGTDRVHRWRNWQHVIPGELVGKDKANIKQAAATAGRDINMFRYWFYQPK
jgi:hypothetical protein